MLTVSSDQTNVQATFGGRSVRRRISYPPLCPQQSSAPASETIHDDADIAGGKHGCSAEDGGVLAAFTRPLSGAMPRECDSSDCRSACSLSYSIESASTGTAPVPPCPPEQQRLPEQQQGQGRQQVRRRNSLDLAETAASNASAHVPTPQDRHIVTELTEALAALKLDLAEALGQLDHASQLHNDLVRRNSELTDELAKVKSEREGLRGSSKQLARVLSHLQSNAKESALERSQMRCTAEQLQAERDDYRRRYRKSEREADDFRLQLEQCKEGMMKLSFENRRLGREVERLTEENKALLGDNGRSENGDDSGEVYYYGELEDKGPKERGDDDRNNKPQHLQGEKSSRTCRRTLYRNHVSGNSSGHLFLTRRRGSNESCDTTEHLFYETYGDSMKFLGIEALTTDNAAREDLPKGRGKGETLPEAKAVDGAKKIAAASAPQGRRNSIWSSISSFAGRRTSNEANSSAGCAGGCGSCTDTTSDSTASARTDEPSPPCAAAPGGHSSERSEAGCLDVDFRSARAGDDFHDTESSSIGIQDISVRSGRTATHPRVHPEPEDRPTSSSKGTSSLGGRSSPPSDFAGGRPEEGRPDVEIEHILDNNMW